LREILELLFCVCGDARKNYLFSVKDDTYSVWVIIEIKEMKLIFEYQDERFLAMLKISLIIKIEPITGIPRLVTRRVVVVREVVVVMVGVGVMAAAVVVSPISLIKALSEQAFLFLI
jgi:hypothetical protein